MAHTVDDEPISVLHKHTHRKGFVQVQNSTVRDPRLSFKATGLLCYLLSLPQGAPIGSRVLAQRKPDGRSAIMSAFKELRDHGYVDQKSRRREDGTFHTVTHVYEVPPGTKTGPGFGSPGSDNPGSENRPISLTESKTKRQRGVSVIMCGGCGEMVPLSTVYEHELLCEGCFDGEGMPVLDLPQF